MPQQMIKVIVAVSDYWLVGITPRPDFRLRDELLRPDTDFFNLSGVRVFMTQIGESPVAILPEMLIPKRRILCASTSEEKHESPVKRFQNYQAKGTSRVAVLVENHFIEGTAHLASTSQDVPYTLHREGGRFFSLTQATVRSAHSQCFTFPFLLVNNELVSAFGVPETVEDGPQQAQPARRLSELGEEPALLKL